MRIEILDRARQDFLDGFRFYEKQSKGAGHYFFDSLMADVESLCLYAGVHAKHYGYIIGYLPGDSRMQFTTGWKVIPFAFTRYSIAVEIPVGSRNASRTSNVAWEMITCES